MVAATISLNMFIFFTILKVKPILNTMDLSFVKLKQKDLTEEKLKQMKESLEDYLIVRYLDID